MLRTLILAGLLCLPMTSMLFAHGDLHEQIEKATKRIEQEPNNANLFLKRGQLYAQHQELDNAKSDFVQARLLNPQLDIIDLLLAKVFSENNEVDMALKHINTFLKAHPESADGLIIRSGIHQQKKDELAAQKDLELAFSNIENPHPKHYIDIAETVLRANPANSQEALMWLQKGQNQFGFDIVLKEKEIEILTISQQYEKALSTVDEVLNNFPRKEKWLFKKGEIAELAGQVQNAQSFYTATIQAIQDLPKRVQMTRKMMELETNTVERIQMLSR